MFYIGQEVQCLGPEWEKVDKRCLPGSDWCPNWPEKGKSYHVRSVHEFDGHECIRLVEVVNPPRPFDSMWGEPVFVSRWFVPIRSTDISIFTAMLNPVKEDA